MRVNFNLYTGNRLEDLARLYLCNRRKDLARYRSGNIMVPENVTVASRGMWTWLEQYLVKHGEAVANFESPFINRLVGGIIGRFYRNEPGYAPELFNEDVMRWRIYRLLTDRSFMERGELAPLRSYIGVGEDAPLRASQLAQKASRLYFSYSAYLPELLDSCQVDDGQWQAQIWQALCHDSQGRKLVSPVELMVRFIRQEGWTVPPPEELAPVTVFGISAMPPVFVKALAVYSGFAPVNFYYLNPSFEDWSTQSADRRMSLEELREKQSAPEINNTLLGNLGLQGREFFKALVDESITGAQLGGQAMPSPAFEPKTILEGIQDCVMRCSDEPSRVFSAADGSLSFHSCANAVREIEVLQDCLLKLIADANGGKSPEDRLTMNDIVVMAPDISTFAPLIRAVFDNGPLKNRYCITDRSIRNANLAAEVFLTILGMHRSRFELSRILALLDYEPLRQRYGLSANDALVIRRWLFRAQVRWGEDADSRSRLPGGAFRDFSWEYGLDRLLLNLAMEPDGAYDGMPSVQFPPSAENMRILGAICDIFRNLADFARQIRLEPVNGIDRWCELMHALREQFFADAPLGTADFAMLGRTIDDLRRNIRLAEGDGTPGLQLPFEVVCDFMSAALDTPAPNEPFLDGRITFCSLLPMRSIPCKVIALLGMDEGAFPRREDRLNYNLVLKLRDDASRRPPWLPPYACSSVWEDRYTFLEAILSARRNLMVFYHGMDDSTGEELPMAVPAAELYEYARRFSQEPLTAIRHRLNSADPQNFAVAPHEARLGDAYSYDLTSWKIAQIPPSPPAVTSPAGFTALAMGAYQADPPRLCGPLAHCRDSRRLEIDLKALACFLERPADPFLTASIGLPREEWYEEMPENCDPMELNGREQGWMRRRIGNAIEKCGDHTAGGRAAALETLRQTEQSRGNLPRGMLGEFIFNEMAQSCLPCGDVAAVVEEECTVALHGVPTALPPPLCETMSQAFDVVMPELLPDGEAAVEVIVTGKIARIPGSGLHRCLYLEQPAKPDSSLLVMPYLEHLLLCAARDDDEQELESVIQPCAQSASECVHLRGSRGEARQLLSNIATAYLVAHCLPLPLLGGFSLKIASEGGIRQPSRASDMLARHRLNWILAFAANDLKCDGTGEESPLAAAIEAMAQFCYGRGVRDQPQ